MSACAKRPRRPTVVLVLACALTLTLTVTGAAQAPAVADPPAQVTLPPITAVAPAEAVAPATALSLAPLGLPGEVAAPALPSARWIVWRVVGAFAVVGGLLAATLAILRSLMSGRGRGTAARARGRSALGSRGWLAWWHSATTRAADRLEVLDRRPVGAKESVCIVRAGGEQFLIGVTASRISLLGRLEPASEAAEFAAPIGVTAPLADVDEPAATDFARALEEDGTAPRSPDEDSFGRLLARSRSRLSRLGLDSIRAGSRRD
jgi:hypothetical protein